MACFEEILTKPHLLESIFRHLDIGDHLKLIKICLEFEDAIVNGVWRLMYKHLKIWQRSTGTLVLECNAVDDVMMTECSLATEEFHIILHHSSMYIRELELNNISYLENIISFNYHHLTELSLYDTVVEDTHLQQVAENCINLQSFTLIDFTDDGNQSNICVNVFDKMKALNKLEFNDINFTAWNYFDVQQLFCHVHLKTLIINIKIGDSNDNKGENNNTIDRVYNIENLTIGKLPCLQSGNIRFIEDLIRFENLTKLSITFRDQWSSSVLDDNHLSQINNACPKLCELSITGCNFIFEEFPRMNNLKHLTFEQCEDIRFTNFDEIFRKLELKSLSLVDVKMRYETEDISDYNYISNTLETLTIKYAVDKSILETFFNWQHKFEKVSMVRLDDFVGFLQSTELCFSHNFPYLQELILDSDYISSKDILYLNHLKVLQFKLFHDMSWSYLEILFKHPTLKHITITAFDCQDFKMHYEHFPECCEGLTTTLEYLGLPSVVYESALSFWPSFRQRNKLLKLEIVDSD